MGETLEPRAALRSVLRGLDETTLRELVDAGEEVSFEPGEQLIREGGEADALFVLLDGTVRLGVHHRHRDLVVSTLHAGDLLGWSWLVAPHRWDFDAEAAEPTLALRIPATVLTSLMGDDPGASAAITTGMLAVVSTRLRDARIQMLDLFAAETDRGAP